MGIFSRLFGKKESNQNIRKRKDQPDVIDIATSDDKMNWGMQKARLTIQHFENCLLKPKPGQQYFSIKVKIEDKGAAEHIWLTEPSFDDEGNLYGIVSNHPIDVTNVVLNQKIGIDRKLVSDWMVIENGRLIGGYTIRAIRDGLPQNELANFDKSLGGMIIDEGEDYFLPDNTTPEGAIVLLENAFDEENLDKALDCKDFEVEAGLMMAKMNKGELGAEVISKMAEVLKLSFIKSLQDSGMPKFNDVTRAFPKREKISENHIIVTEICTYPDGGKSVQRLNTYKTNNGWKVLSPEN